MFQRNHYTTDPVVTPVINPPRRMPIGIVARQAYDKIQRMLKTGIIVPVEEPTDWVRNIVPVENLEGSTQCLDPQQSRYNIRFVCMVR